MYGVYMLPLKNWVENCWHRKKEMWNKWKKKNGTCLLVAWASQTKLHSQGAPGTYHAPPPPPPGTFHDGSKMYLRVSRTQSHLFPGKPLGCTGVIALCARVPSCLQSVADWVPVANASFKSLVYYYFVKQWPKCSVKYAWWCLPFRTNRHKIQVFVGTWWRSSCRYCKPSVGKII